jgi:cytidine deaminase
MTIPGGERALVRAAREAAEGADAPYSGFKVGAALVAASGQVLTGCNVENACYGLSMCAERVASGKAVSQGVRDLRGLAICAPGGATPGGACRQVLHEFSPAFVVIISDEDESILGCHVLSDLLPHSVNPSRLDNAFE